MRLAFSPDSDDIFMFWALLNGKVDAEGLVFEAERADTETLNARAEKGDADVIAVSIAQYARAFEALRANEIDAALLIHEGRLFYEREGTSKVVDLGEAWANATGGLPLPLGGNAIRRGLGEEMIARTSRVCRSSIAWASTHADVVANALLAAETRADVGLDKESLDRYLAMYANADTLDAPDDVRRAIAVLFEKGQAAGL